MITPMTNLDSFLFGFIVGMVSMIIYSIHTINFLKKKGYIVHTITEKFKKDFNLKENK